ncbi:MAG: 50S ribosomal protein L13 [Kiritimatiellia bacterium]
MTKTAKSYVARDPGDARQWRLVDAENQVLGRLAVRIADVLRGKDKPTFTPHVDTGDFVVVINAEKVKLTGRKEENKVYRTYSGYRSGLKEKTASEVRARHPERLIELAVKGMLPGNKLSRRMFSRLKVYAGESHPHGAQNPVKMNLN